MSTFYSHIAGLPPLFAPGKPATIGVMRTAEEGNVGVQVEEVTVRIGGPYGSIAVAPTTPAGGTRTLELDVSAQYPMITGLAMVVQTNDGFTGVTGVDAYRMTAPVSMDLFAYDAGTERNNELAPYLIIQGGGAGPRGRTGPSPPRHPRRCRPAAEVEVRSRPAGGPHHLHPRFRRRQLSRTRIPTLENTK